MGSRSRNASKSVKPPKRTATDYVRATLDKAKPTPRELALAGARIAFQRALDNPDDVSLTQVAAVIEACAHLIEAEGGGGGGGEAADLRKWLDKP